MRGAEAVDLPEGVTATWIDSVPELPPVHDHAAVAERLLLLLHYGIDWEGSWVRDHRERYWDRILPVRVREATYRAATLDRWWTLVCTDLQAAPRTATERLEVAGLLRNEPQPVLTVLRDSTEALILRTRIVADRRREIRTAAASTREDNSQ